MADYEPYERSGLDAPACLAAEITPSDSANIEVASRGLYVGTGGNVRVHMATSPVDAPVAITFKNVPAGSILPIRVRRVLATGTTAADIVSLW